MKKTVILFYLIVSFLPFVILPQSLGMGRGYHTILVKADGTVYTWGSNSSGQLGNGSKTDSKVPVEVLRGSYTGTAYLGDNSSNKIIAVAMGKSHSIALAEDGTVYTWGLNSDGELGNSTTTNSSIPIKVSKGSYSGTAYLGDNPSNKIIAVSAGNAHSVALAQDGTVYTWGNYYIGKSNTPVKIPMGSYPGTAYLGDNPGNKIISVSGGFNYSLALAEDGSVYTWGENTYGQLGNNTNISSTVPIKVLMGAYFGTKYLGDNLSNKIISVVAGDCHCIAFAQDNMVYSWGRNTNGQLGDSSNQHRYVPVKVLMGAYSGTAYLGDDSSNKIISLVGGESHSIAFAQDNTAYTWGHNNNGQLGEGTNKDSYVPVKVLKGAYSGSTYLGDNPGNKIIAVSAGAFHSFALAQDGTVYSWGLNSNGQLGINSISPTSLPVIAQVPGGALPVELTIFIAKYSGDKVELQWDTATEENNYGFEVERQKDNGQSMEGIWEKIGFVSGSGNSNSPKSYTFVDDNSLNGKVRYRLKQLDNDGNFEYSAVIEVNADQIPKGFLLSQNFPNPFNPSTQIQFGVSKNTYAMLTIHDILGKKVSTLFKGNAVPGQIYNLIFNRNDPSFESGRLASGIYYYKLQTNEKTEVRKMLLLK
ncbi:MAG: RCC1 domain-containing protein [Ignavibacteriaceae bacterium]